MLGRTFSITEKQKPYSWGLTWSTWQEPHASMVLTGCTQDRWPYNENTPVSKPTSSDDTARHQKFSRKGESHRESKCKSWEFLMCSSPCHRRCCMPYWELFLDSKVMTFRGLKAKYLFSYSCVSVQQQWGLSRNWVPGLAEDEVGSSRLD